MAEQNSFELAASKPSFAYLSVSEASKHYQKLECFNKKSQLQKFPQLIQELQAPNLFSPALDPGVARWFDCPANEALEHATPGAAISQHLGKRCPL